MLGRFAGHGAGNGGEYAKVALLFLYFFCTVAAAILGRTAADALFLSRFDNAALSGMYLPQAATMILTSLVFQRYAHRVRIERLLFGLLPTVAALILVSRIGVGLELDWVFRTIYVGYDVFNFLMIVCFWQFATSVLDQRKAKKMIGLVASGGTLGTVASGFGIRGIVPVIGTSNLLYVFAALVAAGLAFAIAINALCTRGVDKSVKAPASSPAPSKPSGAAAGKADGLFKNVPHLKYMVLLAASVTLSLTLIDYQFKVLLRESLQNEALAGFMGSFQGISGIVGLLVQVTLSGWVLTRFGVTTALLVFPVTLAVASLGLIFLPVLAMSVVAKGSDKVLGDTLNASANQLIMFPVPPAWRSKAKNFMDGIVRNGSKGLAALLLLVLSHWLAPSQFSYIVAILLGIGIVSGLKIKKAYLQTLMSTLKTGQDDPQRTELDFMDPASRALLAEALRQPDKQQALYALRLLKDIDAFDLKPYLSGLLAHPHPQVIVETLEYVEQFKPAGLEPRLLELLGADSEPVRAKAILALASYMDEAHLDEISRQLEDDSADVQAAAIAALVKYFGIEGMYRSVGVLKRLTESEVEAERMAVASLFGQIGVPSFYKPLLGLLRDPSSQVAVRALDSAAKLRVPACIPPIADRLADGGARRHAIQALAAYDEPIIVPALRAYLEREDIAVHLPAVFERIGSRLARDTLLEAYESSGYALRDRILESLLRMQKNLPAVPVAQAERYARLELALDEQYGEHGDAVAGNVAGNAAGSELSGSIAEIRAGIVRRIFQLLSLLYDERAMQAVYANWTEGDGQRQANAIEVVDQTVHGALRGPLIKLMSSSRELTASRASNAAPHWAWLSAQGDAWLSRLAAYARAKQEGVPSDPDAALQVEQVRLLKKISLFQGVPRAELAVLADTLKPVTAAAGDVIIREGEPGDCLYMIESGKVGVFKGDARVHELRGEEYFGEMAVLTQGARTATIAAEEDVRLWKLDSDVFYERMIDRPSMAVEMMKLLSRRIRDALGAAAAGAAVAGAAVAAIAAPALLHAETAASSSADEAKREAAAAREHLDAAAAAAAEAPSGNATLVRRVLVLQQVPLFQHLSTEGFLDLAQLVQEEAYGPGKTICKTGEYGDTLYAVVEGVVGVRRDGREIANLGKGEYFGEMAIIDSGPRSADCVAVSQASLLALRKEQLQAFCFRDAQVLRGMMRVLSERLQGIS
ncbi:ATP/ADP translocase [Cohnella sp. OV330]|uniref:Npt1/Npt2 family nucleotide transporter n=1 Tax=Cohnella sp. OV330 TaxID=1855288 RepID=UPI0008E57942|nr:Npt1/Npt2 family nucleotide transporter [Cohnella sp. OV330]SFB29676.1 ATP/ADP translocase [Cohnella sp. OV330]